MMQTRLHHLWYNSVMLYWVLKSLAGPIVRLIWIKKVAGLENLPQKGPFVVAANHSSYFDFISLMAVLPHRVYFLAAEKFYESWFWRPLVAGTGQIKVDRQNPDKQEVFQKIFELLKNGQVVGIFPEGTRSADGKIGKTFTGVAKIATEAKVPVVPVGISGTYEIMSRHDKKPKFIKNITINIGKPIYLEEYYSRAGDEAAMRQATDAIMGQVSSLII